jgi:hypothetical protein
MHYKKVRITGGEVIVMALDICSSTDILEELSMKQEIFRYEKLVEKIKHYLAGEQDKLLFAPYKFTGDGWILLFPVDSVTGKDLLGFARRLCKFFRREFAHTVMSHLDTPPLVTGINFGVAKGALSRITVYGADEYVGRAINVACRLQAAIKDRDKKPAYKALVANAVFNSFMSPARGYKVKDVKRKLRNIRGGAVFRCKKVFLI